MKEQLEGRLKEAEGKLTGDKTRERQGRAEHGMGELKDKARQAKDRAKREIEERI